IFDGMPSMVDFRLPRKDTSQKLPPVPGAVAASRKSPTIPVPPLDSSMADLVELRSQDLSRAKRVLEDPASWDPLLVPPVIRLLGWDEASGAAGAYLTRCEGNISGQLTDALTNAEVDFAIRRRIPRLLARLPMPSAVEGLLQGLQDQRFEVRFQCG